MKNFVSKELRTLCLKALPKTERDLVKHNGYSVSVVATTRKSLLRWGQTAAFAIDKNGKLLYNNLTDYAWNYDPRKAAAEAANALDYFIHGSRGYDYRIFAAID